MEKMLFSHIYDHNIFFKKWLKHTQDTSILAFTSNIEGSRKAFIYFLKMIECVLVEEAPNVTISKIRSNRIFMEKLMELVHAHTTRTDINTFLLAVKLFKECLIEMISESDLKKPCEIILPIGKAFDVIELTIVDVFHVADLQKLKDILYQVCVDDKEDKVTASFVTAQKLNKLTQSEYAICELIVANSSTKEIAEKLSVSVETIHTHRKRIRKKLEIPSHQNLYSFLKYFF